MTHGQTVQGVLPNENMTQVDAVPRMVLGRCSILHQYQKLLDKSMCSSRPHLGLASHMPTAQKQALRTAGELSAARPLTAGATCCNSRDSATSCHTSSYQGQGTHRALSTRACLLCLLAVAGCWLCVPELSAGHAHILAFSDHTGK